MPALPARIQRPFWEVFKTKKSSPWAVLGLLGPRLNANLMLGPGEPAVADTRRCPQGHHEKEGAAQLQVSSFGCKVVWKFWDFRSRIWGLLT